MELIDILKCLFLFLIAWQVPIIVVRAMHKASVYALSFLMLAVGITGFIYLQFLI